MLLYRDQAWLQQKYQEEKLSSTKMASICKVDATTIRNWLKRHNIPCRRGGPMRFATHDDYFNHWSHEMAYLLGLIGADGTVYKMPRKRHWSINLTNDDIELVKIFWNALSGGQHKIVECRRAPDKTTYMCTISSNTIASRLREQGITSGKSLNWEWPPGLPREYAPSFLRGAIDGDGAIMMIPYKWHLGRTPKRYKLVVAFVSGSKDFVQSLVDFLASIGIFLNMHETYNKGSNTPHFRIRVTGKKAMQICHLIYSTPGPYCHRKRETYKRFLAHLDSNRAGLWQTTLALLDTILEDTQRLF